MNPRAAATMRWLSLLGFAMLLISLLILWHIGALFSRLPWVIALQVAAALLMIWARFTLGVRSFHADASPTAGGLITSGPYRYLRHPIYASICLFLWAGILADLMPLPILLGILGTAGAVARLLCEERLVVESYPEYRAYSATTKRLLPGIW